MVIKSMPSNITASATSITYVQREEKIAANARTEKLLFIGNALEGKKVKPGDMYLSSGNAEDAASLFGFGSPLHRMAIKAYPENGNGSKVETYFMPVDRAKGSKHEIAASINGKSKVNKTVYLRYYDQIFEAAADVASKVATNAQKNEARDPRGTLVNIFEKTKIPFTLLKDAASEDIMNLITETLEEYPEVPFTAEVKTSAQTAAAIKGAASVDVTTLTADDYYIALKTDGGEKEEVSIGTLSAETAQDVIDAIETHLTGATLTAENTGEAESKFILTSDTKGKTSKLEILTPSTGTDLFAALQIAGTATGIEGKTLNFTSKVEGESAQFKIDFVTSDDEEIDIETYGVEFVTSVVSEGAGEVKLNDVLKNITRNIGITRVVSQFNDENALDAMHEYFEGLRDGLIGQYVLCYTARELKSSLADAGVADYSDLIKLGNSRRLDSVNVLITGDYGNLRALELNERNTLLAAGISNFEKQLDNSYKLQDLCTFYHKAGQKNSIYKMDRDICLLGNIAYDERLALDSDDMASTFLLAPADRTDNDCARKLTDIKALLNSRIELWGKAGWIADVNTTKQNSVVQQDASNSSRLNINLMPQLSAVIRTFDLVNICSIYNSNASN